MGTKIRPETSKKNEYWLERHRYYELKHFCLQYPIWKKAYNALDGLSKKNIASPPLNTNEISDPTAKCAESKLFFSCRITMIEKVAKETDAELFKYILKAVTEGHSYDYLKTNLNIPCCKDTYYKLYRKFFWLLNIERQ